MRSDSVRIGAMAIAAVLAFTSPALAQGQWSIDGRGGIAVPVGDLSDLADAGPTFGLGVGYWFNDRVAVRVDGDLDLLSGKDDVAGAPDINLWHYNAGVEVNLAPPASPWDLTLNIGGGLSTVDSDEFLDDATTTELSETYFTGNGGLLVGYDVSSNVNVFARGQWYLIFSDEEDTAPLAGLIGEDGFDTLNSLPITVGLRIKT